MKVFIVLSLLCLLGASPLIRADDPGRTRGDCTDNRDDYHSHDDYDDYDHYNHDSDDSDPDDDDHKIPRDLFKDNFSFESLGIGGIDDIYREAFRDILVSRLVAPNILRQYGVKHVKGMILYGPPGTGKTLLARKISKILSDVEPKIVRGPEIYGRYVGESEENVRAIFSEAIRDQRIYGDNSPVHVIVIDEIDSFCGKRQSSHGNPVHNTVINQFLTMIDGVNELNNIFLIGTTNRLDLLDEAVLRPGRFEAHVHIGLPDYEGRKQIFRIHAKPFVDSGKASDLDYDVFARESEYYTGAEIEAAIRKAVTHCFVEEILRNVDTDFTDVNVTNEDIIYGIESIKGTGENQILKAKNILSRLDFDETDKRILDRYVKIITDKVNNRDSNKFVIMNNVKLNSGKKALYIGTKYCLESNSSIRIITPDDVFGYYSDGIRQHIIENVYETMEAKNSVLFIHNVDDLMGVTHTNEGITYDNYIYQILLQTLKLTSTNNSTIIMTFKNERVREMFAGYDDYRF